jgi:hypothetical protein
MMITTISVPLAAWSVADEPAQARPRPPWRRPRRATGLERSSLAGDNVFSDGWEDQRATIVGAGTDDVTVSLLVRV